MGPDRASYLLEQLAQRARGIGIELPIQHNTPYINTIPPDEEVPFPGDRALERRIKTLTRWNAMAMVSRQNKFDHGIGGHIATYASIATLFEVGFNHFFMQVMEISLETAFISRATHRRECTHAPFWKDA